MADAVLPEISPQDRKDFEWAAAHPDEAQSQVWAIVRRFSDPSDPAVVAGVTAVAMIAPSRNAPKEPWLIRGALRVAESGPPAFSRLSVEHLTDPGRPVTRAVLQRVSVLQIQEAARRTLRERENHDRALAQLGWTPEPGREKWARKVAREAAKLPLKRGRKGYPPDHYRRIALRCIELFKNGRRDVLVALRSEESERIRKVQGLDKYELPRETLRAWISRARKHGFLAQSDQGKIDFRPGPNLYPKSEKRPRRSKKESENSG